MEESVIMCEIANSLVQRFQNLSPEQRKAFNERRNRYPREPMLKAFDEIEKIKN